MGQHTTKGKEPFMREKHAFVYSTRNELLIAFGYRTYKQYLKSDEWKAIRQRVFQQYSECICCDRAAEVVHHVKYDSATLLGLHTLNLAPLCRSCHERMEIDESGEKGSLARANTLMLDMARKKNPKQEWLLRFYRDRKPWKSKRQVDNSARKAAWHRRTEEKQEVPRDYAGVFWIRARRR
jgi:hypothetical protein